MTFTDRSYTHHTATCHEGQHSLCEGYVAPLTYATSRPCECDCHLPGSPNFKPRDWSKALTRAERSFYGLDQANQEEATMANEDALYGDGIDTMREQLEEPKYVVVEVQGGLVAEVHNAEWLAIDWDIFDSGPTDEELAEFKDHAEEVIKYIHDPKVRTNLLKELGEGLRKAGYTS